MITISEHWHNFGHMESSVSLGLMLTIAAAFLIYLLIFPRMVSTNKLLGSIISSRTLLKLFIILEDILVFSIPLFLGNERSKNFDEPNLGYFQRDLFFTCTLHDLEKHW